MLDETIGIRDGSTFAVSNRAGVMQTGPDQPPGAMSTSDVANPFLRTS
jgi:hypothetical protein